MGNENDIAFRRLFWRARKAHVRSGGQPYTDDPDHQAALDFAQDRGWSWAESLLEASGLSYAGEHAEALRLLDEWEDSLPDAWCGLADFVRGGALFFQGEYDEAIEAYREALAAPNFDRPGDAWTNLGNALHEKGKHDEAIEAYREALAAPNYDTPAYAWNNLGNALREKEAYDEAIEAYREALAAPNFDRPGYAWTNLGNALHDKGEYDEAIEAYREALAAPNFDTPGYAWNNLGNALHEKGAYDEAIEAYRKALAAPNYDTPAKAWTNLAQTYVALGDHEKAEEAFKEALASDDPDGFDHSRARLGLQMAQAGIQPEALSPDDRAMAQEPARGTPTKDIESEIIAAIQEAGETQYEKYINQSDSGRDNTLSILRGWSSAVTLLEGSERRWRGGGYFLKWRGYGIVIDPGFDFLRNFHDAGYHGREIHAVVVSHNHPDHNSDVKAIDDLRYELFKRLAKTGESTFPPYVLLWDEDTSNATTFGFEKPRHQYDPVTLASGYPHAIDLLKHESTIPVRVVPFKVDHGSDVPRALGMVVELLDEDDEPAVRIGYTADTAYFEDLKHHLVDCDLLIAHVSQPSIEELQDATKFKKTHLGYRGTARLIKECEPTLALIGEFWAGFTDLRIPLVKGLRQRSGQSAVLPSGLAMHIHLPSLKVECTECEKMTPFDRVKIAPPTDRFSSLAYLCPGCMIG